MDKSLMLFKPFGPASCAADAACCTYFLLSVRKCTPKTTPLNEPIPNLAYPQYRNIMYQYVPTARSVKRCACAVLKSAIFSRDCCKMGNASMTRRPPATGKADQMSRSPLRYMAAIAVSVGRGWLRQSRAEPLEAPWGPIYALEAEVVPIYFEYARSIIRKVKEDRNKKAPRRMLVHTNRGVGAGLNPP
eukprot:6186679-Pleurochrysis_carterae.AAC.4